MTNTSQLSDVSLKRMSALIEELNGESDRAVAVVGAAWVEEALLAAIESFLQKHPDSSKRLFRGNGPLATFSSKIDLARLLGMISDPIRADLHAIREIRNEFAHLIADKTEHTKLTFASDNLRNKSLALRCVKHEGLTNAREAFIRACAILNSDFEMVRFFGVEVEHGGCVVVQSC